MNLLLLPMPPERFPDDADPKYGFGNRSFVGCTLDIRPGAKAPKGAPYNDDVEAEWTFSDEPVQRPNTPYYRAAVLRGELRAANEETAKLCSVPFVPLEVSVSAPAAEAETAPELEPVPVEADASASTPSDEE